MKVFHTITLYSFYIFITNDGNNPEVLEFPVPITLFSIKDKKYWDEELSILIMTIVT